MTVDVKVVEEFYRQHRILILDLEHGSVSHNDEIDDFLRLQHFLLVQYGFNIFIRVII